MPGPWSVTRIWTRWRSGRTQRRSPIADDPNGLAARRVLSRVGHDVSQGATEVRGVGPRREVGRNRFNLERHIPLAVEAVERGGRLGHDAGHVDALRARLEGRGFGARQLPHLHDHAAQGRRGRRRRLEVGLRLGDDPVDHGLELPLQHGGRRGKVMGHVRCRAAAEHLGRLQPPSHGVEGAGQLLRLAVAAAGGPRRKVPGPQPVRGCGHVLQRPRLAPRQPDRYAGDNRHRRQPGHQQRDVEQAQERPIRLRHRQPELWPRSAPPPGRQ